MKSEVIAIIPARGGSKGVPRKNLRPFLGKPLVVHSIEHALNSRRIDRVIVSTDDAQIAAISESAGALIAHRPAEISGDTASSESALLHTLETLYPGSQNLPRLVVFLQATSPIRDDGDIDSALAELDRRSADSLLSVCPSHDFHWTIRDQVGAPINYDPLHRPRRQDLPPQFRENGSIYISTATGLLTHRCRLFGRIALHIMDQIRSFQIDTLEDFAICEALAGLRRTSDSDAYSMPAMRAEA